MSQLFLTPATLQFQETVDHFRVELGRMRANQASPGLVEDILVPAYGGDMPLKQLATITTPEPRVIAIAPWDASVMGAIESAIQKSDLGMQPVAQGNLIRLTLPLLTEERRRDLVRQLGKVVEEHKQRIRRTREDTRTAVDAAEKSGAVSEDEKFRQYKEIERLVAEFSQQVDTLAQKKETELTTI